MNLNKMMIDRESFSEPVVVYYDDTLKIKIKHCNDFQSKKIIAEAAVRNSDLGFIPNENEIEEWAACYALAAYCFVGFEGELIADGNQLEDTLINRTMLIKQVPGFAEKLTELYHSTFSSEKMTFSATGRSIGWGELAKKHQRS